MAETRFTKAGKKSGPYIAPAPVNERKAERSLYGEKQFESPVALVVQEAGKDGKLHAVTVPFLYDGTRKRIVHAPRKEESK